MQEINYGDIFDMADKLHIPASVTIELNTTCNLRCKHCYIPKHNNTGLGYRELTDVFSQLKELGTFELVFTGGEIFKRNDILPIISTARKMGFDVVLFSNATLIDEMIAEKLGNLYISFFSTSIYSLNENIHDGITKVKGSLSASLKGLSYLKKAGVKVEVKTMVMNDNAGEIDEIVTYCQKNNFNCNISPFIFPKANGDITPNKYRIDERSLRKTIGTINQVIKFQEQEKHDDDYMCGSIQHSFGIDANGTVSPCNAMFYDVGNVLESPISQIWESDRIKKIQNIKFGDLKKCRACKDNSFCVRCAGIALSEMGDMCMPYKFACTVAKIRKETNVNGKTV